MGDEENTNAVSATELENPTEFDPEECRIVLSSIARAQYSFGQTEQAAELKRHIPYILLHWPQTDEGLQDVIKNFKQNIAVTNLADLFPNLQDSDPKTYVATLPPSVWWDENENAPYRQVRTHLYQTAMVVMSIPDIEQTWNILSVYEQLGIITLASQTVLLINNLIENSQSRIKYPKNFVKNSCISGKPINSNFKIHFADVIAGDLGEEYKAMVIAAILIVVGKVTTPKALDQSAFPRRR